MALSDADVQKQVSFDSFNQFNANRIFIDGENLRQIGKEST